MVLMGGEHRGSYTGSCCVYNIAALDYESRKQMPEPRINFGAIYYSGGIYVVGGWHNTFTLRADCYDIERDEWANLPPLLNEREGISLCVVNDEWLYAFGEVCTRGKRAKQLKGKWNYTVERMPLFSSQKKEWQALQITCDAKLEQPCMKNMGLFNHYSNRDVLVLFGGSQASQATSFKSY